MAEPFLSEIRIMSFVFAPKGWALCNGQLLPINQNQALFSLLGTTFGGDGRVNFGLPNLQGRTPIHVGSGHTLGEKAGEQAHTLSIAEIPTHVHTLNGSTTTASTVSPDVNTIPNDLIERIATPDPYTVVVDWKRPYIEAEWLFSYRGAALPLPKHVLERADPKSARLLIENNAGLGGCVGARFEEIAQMMSALDDDPRVGVCFDTCHAFASGYDERTPAEVKKTIDELDRALKLSRVDVIHCNDSVTGLGSNRDRHANIGTGQIGEAGFRALLREPRLAKLPFILEVPGAGGGPDAEQVAVLKELAG